LKIAERAKLAIEATVPIGGFDPEEYLVENVLILAKISIGSWSRLGMAASLRQVISNSGH
jgi:hypothetical protein